MRKVGGKRQGEGKAATRQRPVLGSVRLGKHLQFCFSLGAPSVTDDDTKWVLYAVNEV